MFKLARARASGRIAKGHSIKRRGMSLEAKNEFLSNQIAKLVINNTSEPLKVNKNGVVTNLDYNNPKHMKWLED